MDMNINYVFTEQDRKLLQSYTPMIECLGEFLGPYCEVVLHSFEDLHSSVIHIANGHLTGRTLGAPATNIALEKLAGFKKNHSSWEVYFNAKSIRPFRSSSTLIVNLDNQPIGMVCMNWALDMPMNAMVDLMGGGNNSKNENFSQDVNKLIMDHLEPIKNTIYLNKNIPSKNKNFEIIKELHDCGMFEFSAAHKIVSVELGISSATIYKHLRKINS
ncbi:transcriptional regulator [Providencia huaxiensis]|uniref:PAS domain-containing protein n=1 Tax=Providencia rettgeri TaxID=587 RepID=A0A427HDC7_PRORE|nr:MULTISPECIES: PAS domain-containing protein [Providencia]ELR5218446.1 PAS domain-containing protein [Providencia rettgeri]ELR5219867.1 PAS domain-containing protein [Providencia rettgeri]MBV2188885.1 PAS domain-containing protein [Providencia rettgeri]